MRQLAPAWAALVLLAVLAWVVTVQQAEGMGLGSGTMGLALPAFLAMWVAMMAAMMFPSVAPMAIVWSRTIVARSTGLERAWRIATFVTGYLLAWAAFGVVAYVVLAGADRLLEAVPEAGRWIGFAVFAIAGVYQLTPLKDVCLRHCRSPVMSLLHYGSYRGRTRDLRVGFHHGVYCVGCCWGLMLVLAAVGVMNIAAMAVLAAVILLEKLWSRGEMLAKVVGIAFLIAAVVVLVRPSVAPGLQHMEPMEPASGQMSGDMGDDMSDQTGSDMSGQSGGDMGDMGNQTDDQAAGEMGGM